MFNFLMDAGNYEDRKVDKFEGLGMVISTARVSDGKKPFETAVCHPEYNDNDWIIVENYDTKEAAFTGHGNWVEKMTSAPPNKLADCQNSLISDVLFDESELVFERVIDVTEA